MAVHSFASLPHYSEHLDPIWHALPPEIRGTRHVARRGEAPPQPVAGDLLLLASWRDYERCPGWSVVYVEHGAGQSYSGDADSAPMPGYAGGGGLDRVVLFVCPSIGVAARWRARYPAARIVVAGCPKLDALHTSLSDSARTTLPGSTVAVTFHWDCGLCPESRGAWRYYDSTLPALVTWAREHGVTLLGHGHPKLWPRIESRWRRLGVEPVRDLADVFDRADVLVADSTSAMYEFASLDRPVVALNAPWWRRDVEHGLRFWTHVPGPQVDRPGDMIGTLHRQILEPGWFERERRSAVTATYAHRDGLAASRAAAAIMEADNGEPVRT